MTIYRVVLSGLTSGVDHTLEFSGSTISEPNKHLIYLLPITTTTTTFIPGCELICTINCTPEVDCWNSGGTAELITTTTTIPVTTTTTTFGPTTTTTTTIPYYVYYVTDFGIGNQCSTTGVIEWYAASNTISSVIAFYDNISLTGTKLNNGTFTYIGWSNTPNVLASFHGDMNNLGDIGNQIAC